MTTYIKNVSITSSQLGWYTIKATAISSTTSPGQNWVVTTSSNGTVYAQSGDVITSAASLANLSWFVLQGKGVVDGGVVYKRQICLQFDSSGNVRAKYSARDGFTGGIPSPTQVPSAADEVVFWGGGTDAAPTFAAVLPSSGSWMQGRFSEVDDAFWVLTYGVGGGLPTSLLYLEPVPLVYTVGGSMIDPDPCMLYFATGTTSAQRASLASESMGPRGWLSYGGDNELWCRLPGSYRAVLDAATTSQPTIPGGMTVSPSPYLPVPVYAQETLRYGRRLGLSGVVVSGDSGNANTVGDKGEGLYLRYAGVAAATPTLLDLDYPATGSVSSGVVLAAGDLMFPWCSTPLNL